MALTPAQKAAIFAARKKGKVPPVVICQCGRRTRGNPHDGLCTKCWRKTPAGKKWNRTRQAIRRALIASQKSE
jgi:hypothetical protein